MFDFECLFKPNNKLGLYCTSHVCYSAGDRTELEQKSLFFSFLNTLLRFRKCAKIICVQYLNFERSNDNNLFIWRFDIGIFNIIEVCKIIHENVYKYG